MTEPDVGLSRREQHAVLVIARWAQAARWRRLRWSIPNDASWPPDHLAGIEVCHDGMPDQFELLGRRGWRPECVVATMRRTDTDPDVTGVPQEEWFRPSNRVAAGGDAVARRPLHDDAAVRESWAGVLLHEPPPARSRRRSLRLQARAAAVALVLAIPTGVSGVVLTTGDSDDDGTQRAVAGTDSPITVAPAPPMPAGADEWASQGRARLASMDEQLDMLAAAESAWSSLPAAQRAGSPPAELERLQAAWKQLVTDRAELKRQLTAFEELQRSRETLQVAEQRLAQLGSGPALADTDADAPRQLRTEAERLATQAAHARQQVDSSSRAVQLAAADPLPPPGPVEPVAEAVLALAAAPPDPVAPEPDRTDAPPVADREPQPGPEPQPAPDVIEDVPADEPTSGDIAALAQACADGKGIGDVSNESSDEEKLAALRAAGECFAQVYGSAPAAEREAFEADAGAPDVDGR